MLNEEVASGFPETTFLFMVSSQPQVDISIRNPVSSRKIFSFKNMRFDGEMSGWWWLYWRFYDTRIPMNDIDAALGSDAPKARQWLETIEKAGLATRRDGCLELTEPGAFWLHLVQNHFASNFVNTLWSNARLEPWPPSIMI